MAVTAAQITEFTIIGGANGYFDFYFTYTPTSSYTAGGEVLTKAVARSALGGISDIKHISCSLASKTSDGSDASLCAFSPVVDATNVGTFHIYTATDAHLHSFLVKGGQAAAGTDAVSSKGSSPNVIGKEAVTDLTSLGGATNGGVQSSTIDNLHGEVAAASSYSAYTIRCRGLGRA